MTDKKVNGILDLTGTIVFEGKRDGISKPTITWITKCLGCGEEYDALNITSHCKCVPKDVSKIVTRAKMKAERIEE